MTFTERVADLFRSYPHAWIDGNVIAKVGGCYAYRTRISECRTLLGMRIENRVRKTTNGVRVSEYRYIPTLDMRVMAGEAALAKAHEDRPLRSCVRCGDATHHEDYCEA